MTNEERRLALYCLKANSNLHGEVCEECSQYPECDHFIQDGVMEKLIEELEHEVGSMTNEDKINYLKDILSEINESEDAVCYLTSEDSEVIESAIKALEQEPCKDTISREDAIGAVANLFEMSEYPHPYPQGKPIRLKDIKEKLKQLPPVQPKIKVGHWIHTSGYNYHCSECDFIQHESMSEYKYCPNCGCHIKGESDIKQGLNYADEDTLMPAT